MIVRFNLFFHIEILIFQLKTECTGTILFVHICHRLFDKIFLEIELLKVVVTNDILDCCLLHSSVKADNMEEPLIVLGKLRPLLNRQKRVELCTKYYCIDHLIFGIPRMDVSPLNKDLCRCCVKVLVFKFSYLSTVKGV